MKIYIGQRINAFKKPTLALEFPGVGILNAKEDETNFAYIELNKKQMMKLHAKLTELLKNLDVKIVYNKEEFNHA